MISEMFSDEGFGMIRARFRRGERGRLPKAALARVTLILAFSHKGRRDPLASQSVLDFGGGPDSLTSHPLRSDLRQKDEKRNIPLLAHKGRRDPLAAVHA